MAFLPAPDRRIEQMSGYRKGENLLAQVLPPKRVETLAAFNLGGGPANAVSLREVLTEITRATGRTPRTTAEPWRGGSFRSAATGLPGRGPSPVIRSRENAARG